ncbi:unnamed protein product [[Candida] boidinii]|nr:unnamed protein product [[Candida] boidinii]
MLEKTTAGSISLGDIVYSAIKPIVRMYLIIGSGYLMTRKGLLSIETTRALSDLVLICFMPALFFDKIVSNISIDDLETIGVICLLALVMYAFNGIVTAIIIATTPVPKLWRGNALLAGVMQNVSDLPIAYIQSLATGLVFTEEQGEKGVSFVIIWVCMYIFFQFNLGFFQLVEYDYKATEKYELEQDDEEKNISSSSDDLESDNTKNSNFNSNNNDNNNNDNNNEKSQIVTKKPSILKVNKQNKQKDSVNGVNDSAIMNDEATEISKLTINDFDAEGELVRPISHISTLSSKSPADNDEEEEAEGGDSSSLTDESFDSMELAPRLLTEKKPRANSTNTTHSKVSFKSNHTITSINSNNNNNSNNNKNSSELARSLSKNSTMSKISNKKSHLQKPLITFTPIAKIPSARIHNDDDYYHLTRNISNTTSSVRHRSTGNNQTHSANASISMSEDDPTVDTIDSALETENDLPHTSLKGLATRRTTTNKNPSSVQPLTKIKSNATDRKSITSFGSMRPTTHTVTNAFSGSGSYEDGTHSYSGNDNLNNDDDINSIDSRFVAAPTMTEALVREYSRVEPYNRNIPTSIAIATETNLSKKHIEKSGENIPFIQKYKLNWLVFLLKNFLKPNSVVLIVSLAIALIPWTKALFIQTKTHIPNAPDGQPPLSFILQYTEYLGQPCVPVGLLLLGSTIARLEINELPKGFWKSVLAHTSNNSNLFKCFKYEA